CLEVVVPSRRAIGIVGAEGFAVGNATIGDVIDLDGDKIPEVISRDDRFAYFTGLSFADSPFLPLVLCRSVTGLYHDCTPRFPSYLRHSAERYETILRSYLAQNAVTRLPDGTGSSLKAFTYSLGIIGSYLRLSDQDAAEVGWQIIRALCSICYTWLSNNSYDLSQALRKVQPQRYDYMLIDQPS